MSPGGKENIVEFEDPFPGGLLGLFVGKSGGMELRPIRLFSILEHAALMTPNFRDLKSLTLVFDDPNGMCPLWALDFRFEDE